MNGSSPISWRKESLNPQDHANFFRDDPHLILTPVSGTCRLISHVVLIQMGAHPEIKFQPHPLLLRIFLSV
jgi:hypothetical protein